MDLNLREMWEHKDLFYFFVWRDIKVRYKQTLLGAAWAVIQPFFTMVVFSIFFGKFAQIPSDGFPYPVFAYCSLLPWQLFARALTDSSNSIVSNKNLIAKAYFPRLIIPFSSVFASLADFAIAFVVLLGMMLYYGIVPTSNVFMLPLFLSAGLATAMGVGLWLSALNVEYRDVYYTIPFLTQLWLFATPVAYPSSLVPEYWRVFYGLNPMVGVVEGFRWALLGKATNPGPLLAVSLGTVILLFISGLFYFRRVEKNFADVA